MHPVGISVRKQQQKKTQQAALPDVRKWRGKLALTAEALAQQTSIDVLLEAEGAVVDGQGAVFQRRAQQGANSLVRGLCGTTR